jgi:hypothetical protein
MRIVASLLGLTLLGCQATPPPSTSSAVASPPIARPATAPEIVPPAPRQPLARLNPRRQRLQVGEAPGKARPKAPRVGVVVVTPQQELRSPQLPPPPAYNYVPRAAEPRPNDTLEQIRRSQARIDTFLAQEQERLRQNREFLAHRPQPGGGLTPEMERIAYPQLALPQVGP